jgi:hypothetical protein
VTTADRLARVAARLRGQGFDVVEVPGWRDRGTSELRPAGALKHHTAGPRKGDAPSLRVCTFGRPDLRNALCTWFVSRSGVIYLVAGRVAWHAGQGVKGSNTTLIGTEAEHTGLTDEPWTPESLAAQAAIDAECAREFGYQPERTWDHKEHAPRRKIDRTGIDPFAWRHRVVELHTGRPAVRPPDQPPTIAEDDDMIRPGDRGPQVVQLQHLVNRLIAATGGWEDGHLRADGVYGPATQDRTQHAIWRMEQALGWNPYAQPAREGVTAATIAMMVAAVEKLRRAA